MWTEDCYTERLPRVLYGHRDRKGGPKWETEQSNRQEENLLKTMAWKLRTAICPEK